MLYLPTYLSQWSASPVFLSIHPICKLFPVRHNIYCNTVATNNDDRRFRVWRTDRTAVQTNHPPYASVLLFALEMVAAIRLRIVRDGCSNRKRRKVTGNATSAVLSGNVNSSVVQAKSVNCRFAFYGGSRAEAKCSRMAALNTGAPVLSPVPVELR